MCIRDRLQCYTVLWTGDPTGGCSVICKPDVITPGAVMELVNICKEAEVPDGVVSLLSGDPAEISNELIESDIIKKVSVTGSTRVGKIILKKAADKVQRVTMELSGHSPFIVCEDVDMNKVADCLLYTSPSPRDATLSRMPSSA